MSYTIMYGRQFIKTTRGIIPLALYGSNNVYEFINGREVREKNWGIYGQKPEYATDEYLALAESYCGSEYQQHFMRNGKWVDDKGFMSWVKNGIRKALTIEEIKKEIPSQCLYCDINVGHKETCNVEQQEAKFLHTTADLEAWLDKAYVRLQELKGSSSYTFISISFMGREPLKINAHTKPTGQVLIAIGRGKYITEIERRAYTYSADLSKALVFDSPEEARRILADYDIALRKEMRFIKAENKETVKDYRILAMLDTFPNGIFVKKLTKNALRFTYNPDYALRFTESAAKKYVEKLGNRFIGVLKYEIVKVTEGGAK